MAVGRFFFLCSPDCPKQLRTSFLFYKFLYAIVSAKVSALKRRPFKFLLASQRAVVCQLYENFDLLLTLLSTNVILACNQKLVCCLVIG